MIDFGVSLRLFEMGEEQNNEIFRGNLNFASPEHLMNCRASRIDDLYSLLCVAYKFVFHWLPWEEYIQELHRKDPERSDLLTFEKISELRFTKIHIFEKALARKSAELNKLFAYVLRLRSKQILIAKKLQQGKEADRDLIAVDYDKLLRLLPACQTTQSFIGF